MKPSLLEKFSRYLIYYHFQHVMYTDNHHLLTNWYYGDAVYAPMYYGYGAPGAVADRQKMARRLDAEVMRAMPDMVLVHISAHADVIRQRMTEGRHPYCVLKEEDVDRVLLRFQEEYRSSLIRRRFTLDTSEHTPEDTLSAFMQGNQTPSQRPGSIVLPGLLWQVESIVTEIAGKTQFKENSV